MPINRASSYGSVPMSTSEQMLSRHMYTCTNEQVNKHALVY